VCAFLLLDRVSSFIVHKPNVQMESAGLLTTTKASERLQVHPNTPRSWEKDGFIRVTRTPGNHRLYHVSEFEKKVEEKQHDQPSYKTHSEGIQFREERRRRLQKEFSEMKSRLSSAQLGIVKASEKKRLRLSILRNMSRARRARAKMSDIVRDVHYKTANFLCENFTDILLPRLNPSR
jgi:DNA-binding transcriptional MerR regulator